MTGRARRELIRARREPSGALRSGSVARTRRPLVALARLVPRAAQHGQARVPWICAVCARALAQREARAARGAHDTLVAAAVAQACIRDSGQSGGVLAGHARSVVAARCATGAARTRATLRPARGCDTR